MANAAYIIEKLYNYCAYAVIFPLLPQGVTIGGENYHSVSKAQGSAEVPANSTECCEAPHQTSEQPGGGQRGEGASIRQQG